MEDMEMEEKKKNYTIYGIAIIWVFGIISLFVDMPWNAELNYDPIAGFLACVLLSVGWFASITFWFAMLNKPDEKSSTPVQ